jgi:putative endonuclease
MTMNEKATPYIGITSDLVTRIWQHKTKAAPSFTSRYHCDQLVYFEMAESAEAAITREKQLTKSLRDWKIELIEGANPDWTDLHPSIATLVTRRRTES